MSEPDRTDAWASILVRKLVETLPAGDRKGFYADARAVLREVSARIEEEALREGHGVSDVAELEYLSENPTATRHEARQAIAAGEDVRL